MSKIKMEIEVVIASDDAQAIEQVMRDFGKKETTELLERKLRSSVEGAWGYDSRCYVDSIVRVLNMPWERLELSRPFGHRPSTCCVCQFRHQGFFKFHGRIIATTGDSVKSSSNVLLIACCIF